MTLKLQMQKISELVAPGKERTLWRRVPVKCECGEQCPNCDGNGGWSIPAHQSGGNIVDQEDRECKLCEGTGRI